MAVHADDLVVDKQDQLKKVEPMCLPDEVIRAVLDLKGSGTGFLGITDKRIIFYDKSMVTEKKAVISIPYSRMSMVGSEDDKGFLIKSGPLVTGRLTVSGLGFEDRTFEFRGGDKAHLAHQLIMEYLL
ncbi:MAG: PH domain-containing protein [Dehalococcoidia bacterium]|nr:PH domain-containing protein [Dehalococcoidia bacterium]